MSLALEPQRLTGQPQDRNPAPEPVPGGLVLAPALGRFWRLFRLSIWRAFEHDAFGTAKASAYSSIFTFFPALLVLGAVLATLNRGEVYLREISYALGTILPAGSSTALSYLRGSTDRPVGLLISTSLLTVWSASGAIISWMDGFRRAYQLPKTWGIVQERVIAISLVLMAGLPLTFATILVAFGSRIETRILFHIGHEFGPLILLAWGAIRWLHRHPDQHRRDPAYLSQRRAPHPALAQRFAGRCSCDRHVADLHRIIWMVFAALCRLQRHLRFARRGHCAAALDVHHLAGGADWRRIQCHAFSSLSNEGSAGAGTVRKLPDDEVDRRGLPRHHGSPRGFAI